MGRDYSFMRAIWIVAACMCLITGAPAAQEAASAASSPPLPAPIHTPQQAASVAPPASLAADQAWRQDIATILATTAKIAKAQEDEGSLLLKVRDGFITNALWEMFGFKSTEKTLAGYAISLLGILGLILKAVWFVSKRGEPEPKWARGLTYAYLVVVVSVFTLLAFSGGVVAEVPASSSAAKPLVEASARLEAAADKLLRAHAEGSAKPAASTPPSPPIAGQEPSIAEALAALRRELNAISAASDAAAKSSAVAAQKSTGWGWHLIIVLLLAGVLLLQLVAYKQTRR